MSQKDQVDKENKSNVPFKTMFGNDLVCPEVEVVEEAIYINGPRNPNNIDPEHKAYIESHDNYSVEKIMLPSESVEFNGSLYRTLFHAGLSRPEGDCEVEDDEEYCLMFGTSGKFNTNNCQVFRRNIYK